MKNIPLALSILLLGSCTQNINTYSDKIYHGSWFDIRYPKSFMAKQSNYCSENKVKNCDSAVFSSQDKKVKLYVFSPQWAGSSKEYLFETNQGNDKIVFSNTKHTNYAKGIMQKDKKAFHNTTTIKKICYKHKGLFRAYEIITNEITNTRTVFGIEHNKPKKMCGLNKNIFIEFKNSLVKYGD